MITCKECIERLFPEDPRKPFYLPYPQSRYLPPVCESCDKPTYYRELEAQSPPEQIIIHRQSNMSEQESDLLQQTALKADYLLKKLNEKKPYAKKYNTYE